MSLVKDKDVMAVTVMADVDGEEEEFEDGWDAIQNDYLIIILILDFLLVNPYLPFRGNEPLIPLIPHSVTLTLAYPWVEG